MKRGRNFVIHMLKRLINNLKKINIDPYNNSGMQARQITLSLFHRRSENESLAQSFVSILDL